MYREWGYVALSRGREANRLYLVQARGERNDSHKPPERDEQDPRQVLIQRLERSRAEPLAVEQLETARRHALKRLGERRSELRRAVDELSLAVAEAEERVAQLVAARPWRRGKREELADARREAEVYRDDLAANEQLLAEIDQRAAEMPTIEQLLERLTLVPGRTAERSPSRQREQEPPSLGLGL